MKPTDNQSNEQMNQRTNEQEITPVSQPRMEENTSSEVNEADMKRVTGGSSLTSGANDFSNAFGGSVTVSNSSNGTAGDRSYSNDDSHTVDYGFGQSSQQSGY